MSWFCDFIHICPTQLLLHDNLLSTLGYMHKSDVVLHDVSFRYAACQQCMWLYESSVTCMCSLVMFMCACVCVFWVTRSYLFVVWVDGDIVPPASCALEYAGCLCCLPACSAFLALSYNGALEHPDVIKPFKLLQFEFQLSGKTSIPM